MIHIAIIIIAIIILFPIALVSTFNEFGYNDERRNRYTKYGLWLFSLMGLLVFWIVGSLHQSENVLLEEREYSVVTIDDEGKISSFYEKDEKLINLNTIDLPAVHGNEYTLLEEKYQTVGCGIIVGSYSEWKLLKVPSILVCSEEL